LDSQSTNTMTTPENLDVSKIQAQTQDSKIEIPPFLKNLPIDYLNIPKQRPQEERQGVMEDKIMNILSENQVLKKRLELSQKIIGLLQQKIQYEPVAIPDYPPPELFPESLMRFQFYNNPDN